MGCIKACIIHCPMGGRSLRIAGGRKISTQMRRFSIDAKIAVRDTTLKNVVTNQMCWKVWTFVRRFFSLRRKFIGSKFPLNFDENCSLSRELSELYATVIPQNKTLFSHRDLRMRCLSLVHVIVINFTWAEIFFNIR
jgi:hypothetical protein